MERTLPPARRETEDVTLSILWVGGGTIGGMLAAALLMAWWLFPTSLHQPTVLSPALTSTAPRLQQNPRQDLAAFRAQEAHTLNGTYWIDRTRGVVHIPIEQAMRKIAADGIPDWPSPQQRTGR